MWFDDAPEQRVGRTRCKEVIESGVNKLATSCPFCMIMMKDGLSGNQTKVEVQDVAEILLGRIKDPSDVDGIQLPDEPGKSEQ